MKHFPKITLLFLVVATLSCSKTGTKALESGDYYNATLQAIEKLTKDRNNDKAADVLPNAYRLATDELLKNIQRSENANVQFRYENALEDYNKLNKMHDLIGRCMACRKLVSPTAYFKETEKIRDLAAEERYEFGLDLMKKNTLQAGRDAFKSFEKLYAFAPNYKDVRTRMDDALFMGSVHVVVEQPKLNSRLFSYSNEYFQGQINDFLRTNRRLNQFIRFYEPSEAEQIRLKPNHIIRLEFVDFVVGETRMNSREMIVTSADSVKTGSAKIDGKTVDVYGKVTAKLIQYTKQVRSRGILLMEIYDFQNKKTLLREEFPGEFNWMNEWASFNGDERALNKEQLLLTRNREQLPPPPQDLFIEFCKPIYNQFTSRVKRFYDKL